MNKVELVSSVQKTLGTSKADAERAVNAVIDGIKAGVKKSKSGSTCWIWYIQGSFPQRPAQE